MLNKGKQKQKKKNTTIIFFFLSTEREFVQSVYLIKRWSLFFFSLKVLESIFMSTLDITSTLKGY
jgi:hypothetical protein